MVMFLRKLLTVTVVAMTMASCAVLELSPQNRYQEKFSSIVGDRGKVSVEPIREHPDAKVWVPEYGMKVAIDWNSTPDSGDIDQLIKTAQAINKEDKDFDKAAYLWFSEPIPGGGVYKYDSIEFGDIQRNIKEMELLRGAIAEQSHWEEVHFDPQGELDSQTEVMMTGATLSNKESLEYFSQLTEHGIEDSHWFIDMQTRDKQSFFVLYGGALSPEEARKLGTLVDAVPEITFIGAGNEVAALGVDVPDPMTWLPNFLSLHKDQLPKVIEFRFTNGSVVVGGCRKRLNPQREELFRLQQQYERC